MTQCRNHGVANNNNNNNNRLVSISPSYCFLFFVVAAAAFSSSTTTTHAFQPARIVIKPPVGFCPPQVQLECCPLIGGPPFLPLHVQVVVLSDDSVANDDSGNNNDNAASSSKKQRKHKFDFIPQQAKEPQTLINLITLQEVEGELRCIGPSTTAAKVATATMSSAALVERAQYFTANYENNNLHILKNNCWTFAWKLVQHLNESNEIDKN